MIELCVICFTICFCLFTFSRMSDEKVQAIENITHNLAELKNGGTDDEDAS